jgi:hypothetical protein
VHNLGKVQVEWMCLLRVKTESYDEDGPRHMISGLVLV